MEPKWAEENLQTIRTLMERSAVYRRALAPIMIFAGIIGVAAAAIGILWPLNTFQGFIVLWFSAAILAIIGALLIARRQALKDQEVFWSPPTRRVVQALLPPLAAGLCLGVLPVFFFDNSLAFAEFVTPVWVLFYGFALHSAGFFMSRGIKLFGWVFIICPCLLAYAIVFNWTDLTIKPHWVMGFFFGGLHLAYGAYLYLTERKNPVA